jgi:ankyrin repeat protein
MINSKNLSVLVVVCIGMSCLKAMEEPQAKRQRIVSIAEKAILTRALIKAVEDNNLEKAQELVIKGADINGDVDGTDDFLDIPVPLGIAAKKGHREIVQFLVDQGAGVECGGYDDPPLVCAAEIGNIPIIDYLIKHGADGHTKRVLFAAVKSGNLEAVRYLVEQGAPVNVLNDDCNPLHAASERGYLDIARFLVEKGALVNTYALRHETPLHLAAQRGHLEVVRFLVEQGAHINAVDNCKLTPLYYCFNKDFQLPFIFSPDEEIVKYLIRCGADLNLLSRNKRSYLDYLAEEDCARLPFIKLLISTGAKINHSGYHHPISHTRKINRVTQAFIGEPLSLATALGEVDLAEKISAIETNLTTLNTALYYGAAQGHKDIVLHFLKKCTELLKPLALVEHILKNYSLTEDERRCYQEIYYLIKSNLSLVDLIVQRSTKSRAVRDVLEKGKNRLPVELQDKLAL